jgi:hypothetical protein
MNEILGLGFSIALFSCGGLALALDSLKKDFILQKRSNGILQNENKILLDKNKFLVNQIDNLLSENEQQKLEIQKILSELEKHEFPVGCKVSWLDKSGEVEYGEVVDDSKVDGKLFVHLRRINKKGNFVGGIISLPSNKLKLEN